MNYFIYIILIISTLFQDFWLKDQIGEIGKSFTSIIVPIIFAVYFIFGYKKIKISKYTKVLLKLFGYLMVINLISLFIYLVIGNGDLYILSENIIVKTFKASSYFIDIILFLILIENLQASIKLKHVFIPFVLAYYTLFCLLILELLNTSLFNKIFHSGTDYNRIRLTCSEASGTGTLIVLLFAVVFYYYRFIKKSYINMVISSLVFVIFSVVSSSKGLIISLMMSIIIYIFSKRVQIKWYKKFVIAIGLCLFAFLTYETLFANLKSDIQNYTSIITRSYTIYCAFKYSIMHPFGTGTTLYLKYYQQTLYDNLSVISNMNYSFNLQEIYDLIYTIDGKNLAAKSGILQYGMYWGIIGNLYFMFYYFYAIYKDMVKEKFNGYKLLVIGYIFVAVSILCYINFEGKYEIWAFISIIVYQINNKRTEGTL